MRSVLTSSFTWQFLGGFVAASLGVLALSPSQAAPLFHHGDVVVGANHR